MDESSRAVRPAEPVSGGRKRRRGGLRLRKVILYYAENCHLCERAREVVEQARGELDFTLELVDIGGDADLELRYRELIPVVEIDGERAFTYVVPRAALRHRLA